MHSMTTLEPSKRGTKKRARDSALTKMVLVVDLNSPVLDVDLNSPPINIQPGEGTSCTSHTLVSSRHSHATGNSEGFSQLSVGGSNTSLIDLEAIEDDVQLLSGPPRSAPIRNNTRRSQPITVILDEDLDSDLRSGITVHRRERNSQDSTYISHDYFDLEDENKTKSKNAKISSPEAPEAPKEPTFICPVCLNTLVDPISTVCGHIFCERCIEASIKAQKKCPTCRKKLTMSNFHRVYLPTTG